MEGKRGKKGKSGKLGKLCVFGWQTGHNAENMGRATPGKSFKSKNKSFIIVFCRPYGANVIIYHLSQGLRPERTGHALTEVGSSGAA